MCTYIKLHELLEEGQCALHCLVGAALPLKGSQVHAGLLQAVIPLHVGRTACTHSLLHVLEQLVGDELGCALVLLSAL